jgi:hypothetical protein
MLGNKGVRSDDFDELAFLSDELGRPTDYFLCELG